MHPLAMNIKIMNASFCPKISSLQKKKKSGCDVSFAIITSSVIYFTQNSSLFGKL